MLPLCSQVTTEKLELFSVRPYAWWPKANWSMHSWTWSNHWLFESLFNNEHVFFVWARFLCSYHSLTIHFVWLCDEIMTISNWKYNQPPFACLTDHIYNTQAIINTQAIKSFVEHIISATHKNWLSFPPPENLIYILATTPSQKWKTEVLYGWKRLGLFYHQPSELTCPPPGTEHTMVRAYPTASLRAILLVPDWRFSYCLQPKDDQSICASRFRAKISLLICEKKWVSSLQTGSNQ